MRPLGRWLWKLSFGNPLLGWRLRRSVAYTWPNFILFIAVLMAAAGSALHLTDYILSRRMVAKTPPSQRQQIKIEMGFSPKLPGHTYGSEDWAVVMGEQLQQTGLVATLSWTATTIFSLLLFPKRRRPDLGASDILTLPLTPEQVMVATHDWPIFKSGACFAVILLLTLLPGRAHHDIQSTLLKFARPFGCVHPHWLLFTASLTFWCFLLLTHRTGQCLRMNRAAFYQSRIFWGWIVWILQAAPIVWLSRYNWPDNSKSAQVAMISSMCILILADIFILYLFFQSAARLVQLSSPNKPECELAAPPVMQQ